MLCTSYFLGDPSAAMNPRRRSITAGGLCAARSGASKVRQQVQHLGQARAQHVLSSHGPEQMLHDAEHDETEEDADQAIADDGGAEGRAKVL